MEIWKQVVGYEGLYEVSNKGRLRRVAPWCDGRKTIPGERGIVPKKTGYVRVTLYCERVKKEVAVHRLVMEAFVGALPSIRHQVNHINGKRADNRLENLEYVTPSENQSHAWRTLSRVSRPGSKHHNAKLTEALVMEIRRRYGAGEKQIDLSTEFGIGRPTISQVCTRKLWTHV